MSDDGIPDRMGLDWEISARKYDVVVERDVEIPVEGGEVTLVADVFRPDTDEEVPAVIGAHPYNTEYQSAPIKPKSIGPQMAWIESGDPYYFPRRGYAHVVVSLRGPESQGESSGTSTAARPKTLWTRWSGWPAESGVPARSGCSAIRTSR